MRRSSRQAGRATASCSQPLCEARVEHVAQAVAHQVDRKHGRGEDHAGRENDPGREQKVGTPFGHDVAPARHLRRRAGSEERQERLDQDRGGANVSRLHDQRRERVGQDMAEQDLAEAAADDDGGFDIGLLADRQHDAAHQAHHARHLDDRDGDDDGRDAGLDHRHQRDGEEDRRDRHQAVHEAHQDGVGNAAVAGDEPDQQPDDGRQHGHHQPDDERNAAAMDRAAPDIAADAVGARQMDPRRRLHPLHRVEKQRVVAGQQGSEQGGDDHHQDNGGAERDGRMAPRMPGEAAALSGRRRGFRFDLGRQVGHARLSTGCGGRSPRRADR